MLLPIDTRSKLNVHKTFRRRPGRPVHTGLASMHEKCPNSMFFRSISSRLWSGKFSNSVQIRENTDQVTSNSNTSQAVYLFIFCLQTKIECHYRIVQSFSKTHLLLQSWKIVWNKQNQLTNACWFWHEVVV